MVKLNYSAGEKSIEKLQAKLTKERLLQEAANKNREKEQQKKSPQQPIESSESQQEENLSFKQKTVHKVISRIQQDLRRLNKKSRYTLFERLNLKKSDLRRYVKNPELLDRHDWEQIKKVQDQIHHQTQPIEANEAEYNRNLVKNKRVKSINRRFNVKEGWLPL
ncbi:MAG: hypothetical protein ACQEP8_04395 [Chlamydiota bacterium]